MGISKKFIFISLIIGALALPALSLAQNPPTPKQDPSKYTLLEPLPLGTGGTAETQVDISTYLSELYRLVIILAGALAVFRLIQGGFVYITSAAFNQKADAKKEIQQTLGGLALVVGSWIIVATIFSGSSLVKGNLFSVSFNIPVASSTPNNNLPTGEGGGGGTVLPGYKMNQTMLDDDARIKDILENSDPPVTFNNNDKACVNGEITGCTNAYAMPQQTINGLEALAKACAGASGGSPCSVEVTGGTEGGHAAHGPNKPAVDLDPSASLNAYLAKVEPRAANPVNNLSFKLNGATFTYETTGANGRATGNHWHVSF